MVRGAAWTLALCALGLCSVGGAGAARILAAAPLPSLSHFRVFESLLRALAERGHDLTVISHFPQQSPLPNYTDISLVSVSTSHRTTKPFFPMKERNILSQLIGWLELWEKVTVDCRQAYTAPQVRRLLASDQQFDLALVEVFAGDCMAGLAHRFRVPLVGMASSMALPWMNDRMGNPDHPAYMENFFLPMVAPFSFWKRVGNTLFYLIVRLAYWWVPEKAIDAIERQAFGPSAPPTSQLVYNTSLILLNSHFSINQPVPLVPAMVEIGGLHIQKPQRLPKDLQQFMDSSEHGVVYFSMGTVVRSDSMPPEQLQGILQGFASLPQRVLWKVDATTFATLPPNVRTSAWVPQNDVLNHPKLVAFITHGGLLGLQEAVAAGVPMLVVPVIADQLHNAVSMEKLGVAERLSVDQFTGHNMRAAIDRLVNDTSYRERAKYLSQVFLDRPRPPLEEAVYWVEYVLRHGGAPHLRSAALDLAWYQYLLLDVAALVLATLILVVASAFIILQQLIGIFFGGYMNRQKKVKIN